MILHDISQILFVSIGFRSKYNNEIKSDDASAVSLNCENECIFNDRMILFDL